MVDKSINLFEELEKISKVHWLVREDIDQIMVELSKRIVSSLGIERVSIWLLTRNNEAIVSIGEYDSRTNGFKRDSVLLKSSYPSYFKALALNKILLVENIHTHEYTKELDKDYSIPYGVESLMDVPIRIAGELVGVMCFEKTGTKKKFNADEQSFAFSLSLVLASNLETRHRRAAQARLEHSLREKDFLVKEISHRVRNNFSILISLMRMSKEQSKSSDPKMIFAEYEQKILSMLKIHDLLFQTENYSIKLTDYIHELVNEFKQSNPHIQKSVNVAIDNINFTLPTRKAVHMGLMISEILSNSVKYGYRGSKGFQLNIEVSQNRNKSILIKIGDNGPGFNFKQLLKSNTLGLPIIKDLADGMELIAKYPVKKGDMYEFLLMADAMAEA